MEIPHGKLHSGLETVVLHEDIKLVAIGPRAIGDTQVLQGPKGDRVTPLALTDRDGTTGTSQTTKHPGISWKWYVSGSCFTNFFPDSFLLQLLQGGHLYWNYEWCHSTIWIATPTMGIYMDLRWIYNGFPLPQCWMPWTNFFSFRQVTLIHPFALQGFPRIHSNPPKYTQLIITKHGSNNNNNDDYNISNRNETIIILLVFSMT